MNKILIKKFKTNYKNRVILISIFNVNKKIENKIIEYKQIELKNEKEIFNFYERPLCKEKYESFNHEEEILAYKRIINEFYPSFKLRLIDFL
jgi:hypothetical protein